MPFQLPALKGGIYEKKNKNDEIESTTEDKAGTP
jgi:hypothetical protein